MNTTRMLIAVGLAIASAAARAGGGDVGLFLNEQASTLTRAQVQAELAAAQARGDLLLRDTDFDVLAQASTRTRAEVHAELAAARQLGLVAQGEGDMPIATSEQAAQIRMAGRAAATLAARAGGAS